MTATWKGAETYEAYMGRWSRRLAPRFVEWFDAEPGRRWVDVGCGTGALSAAIFASANPAAVVGIDPSPDFVSVARTNVGDPRARFETGDAASLPVDSDWADAVVAGLVLNFVPDVPEALAEMRRVLGAGGVLGAYVWDYAEGMQLIRTCFDAAIELDPEVRHIDEGERFPVCRPGGLRRAFEDAGLTEVAETALEIPLVFRDFDDYWTPFLGGVGPAPAYVVALEEDARVRLRERLRATLPTDDDGSIRLTARAWAAKGRAR
jgi:SAM-dependent methyltransferase